MTEKLLGANCRIRSSGLAGCDPAALRQTRAYDLLMRLPMLAYALFLALFACAGLLRYWHRAPPAVTGATFAVNLAMRIATLGYLIVLAASIMIRVPPRHRVAASIMIRVPPRHRAEGAEPRISALIGTFLISAVVLFPRRELSFVGETISTLLLLAGNGLAVVVLMRLGRSFSVMAEARRLVTSGAYRWVRHPLYLAEELAVIGFVLQFRSFWPALLLAVQIAVQLRRMRNEEQVLGETFPEYAAYRKTTAMLIPGIY